MSATSSFLGPWPARAEHPSPARKAAFARSPLHSRCYCARRERRFARMIRAPNENLRAVSFYDSGGNQLTAATSSAAGQPDVTLTSGYDPDHNRTSLADNLSSAGLTTYLY